MLTLKRTAFAVLSATFGLTMLAAAPAHAENDSTVNILNNVAQFDVTEDILNDLGLDRSTNDITAATVPDDSVVSVDLANGWMYVTTYAKTLASGQVLQQDLQVQLNGNDAWYPVTVLVQQPMMPTVTGKLSNVTRFKNDCTLTITNNDTALRLRLTFKGTYNSTMVTTQPQATKQRKFNRGSSASHIFLITGAYYDSTRTSQSTYNAKLNLRKCSIKVLPNPGPPPLM